jgi:thiol-disulfide isomerase/thioredoxin
MKQVIIFIIALFIFSDGNSQPTDSKKAMQDQQDAAKSVALAINKKGSDLPIFSIMQFDSASYNTKDIDSDKSVVLVLFNPGCGHCKDFAKMVMANESMFENTQFVFVAGDKTFFYMPDFIKDIEFKKNPHIIIGVDLDFVSAKIFAFEGIPQIMIYGKDKKLIDVLYKEAKPKQLESILKAGYNTMSLSVDSKPQKVIKREVDTQAEVKEVAKESRSRKRKIKFKN